MNVIMKLFIGQGESEINCINILLYLCLKKNKCKSRFFIEDFDENEKNSEFLKLFISNSYDIRQLNFVQKILEWIIRIC